MCGFHIERKFYSTLFDLGKSKASLEAIDFRGPDHSSTWLSDGVFLGHNRLSIIDTSANSAQPFVDESRGLALVFNGCIYNFSEIRQTLKSLGEKFTSTGDTEVLLVAWAKWGKDCVRKFNGMFAFCIYDITEKILYIARDRLGIKPLYYSINSSSFVASSDPRSIQISSGGKHHISATGLVFYLMMHGSIPAPYSIYQNINQVKPGEIITISSNGSCTKDIYWDSRNYADEKSAVLKADSNFLRDLIEDSIRLRMKADVPICFLLSGGLDSSLISALGSSNLGGGLSTISAGFERDSKEMGDEFSASNAIAKLINSNHESFVCSNEEIIQNLPALAKAMAEPMSSVDNIGFLELGKRMQHRFKVAITGQGADEVFGGYNWYQGVPNNHLTTHYLNKYYDRPLSSIRQSLGHSFKYAIDEFESYVSAFFDETKYFSGAKIASLHDLSITLAGDPLKRVDNMMMSSGIESRVPFLDHRVVEYGLGLNMTDALSNGGKHHLKLASANVLPNWSIEQRKGYFPVPILQRPTGKIIKQFRKSLESIRSNDAKLVTALKSAFNDGDTPLGASNKWQAAAMVNWINHNASAYTDEIKLS